MEDQGTEGNPLTEDQVMEDLLMAKEHITILTLSRDIIMEDTITTVSKGMSMGNLATLRAILVGTVWLVWEWFVVLAAALTVLPDISVQSYLSGSS